MLKRIFIGAIFIIAATAHAQTVLNFGIGGQNSAEGRARFLHDVAPAHPRFILIYFGMNDIANEPKILPLPEYIANMRWMIETTRSLHATPIIATVQHVDTARVMTRHKPETFAADNGVNAKIDRFNQSLRTLAAEEHVAVADFNHALDAAGGPTIQLSTDGTHLHAEGYHLLAETFAAQINQELAARHSSLQSADVIACFGDSLTYGTGVRLPDGTDAGDTYPDQLQQILRNQIAH